MQGDELGGNEVEYDQDKSKDDRSWKNNGINRTRTQDKDEVQDDQIWQLFSTNFQ